MTGPRIASPMPGGSGAIVVHRMLADRIPGYQVVPYSSRLEFFPPALRWRVPRPPADIVHTAPDHAPFLRRQGLPLVVTFHNLVVDEFMAPYSSTLQRIHYRTDLRHFLQKSLRIADRITAVSDFTARLVRETFDFSGVIDVIPNGIDTATFAPAGPKPERDRLRVLFAGNPTRRKGVQWLPDIARRLRDEATIVCASGLRGGATERLAAAGVELVDRVPYESMPALYQSVDALLLPTVREGDSLAVLEAMSAGLPVVASRCSSLPERVAHGEGGYLCEIGDVTAFVDAVKKLTDPDVRKRMGQFNRERALAELDVASMARRYADLFNACR